MKTNKFTHQSIAYLSTALPKPFLFTVGFNVNKLGHSITVQTALHGFSPVHMQDVELKRRIPCLKASRCVYVAIFPMIGSAFVNYFGRLNDAC